MIRKEGYLAGYVSIIAVALFFAFPAIHAQAASLYFSPTTVTRSAGQTFSVDIRVNTEGQAINAAQGSIVFDPAKLAVVSISKSGTIFNLWTQDPVFSNSDGTVDFEGGLPSPGYSGSSGLLITISFKVKADGSSSATLVSGAILANDGQGTNILTSLGKMVVSGTSVATPLPTTQAPPPETTPNVGDAPKVDSSTHPDSTKWYSNNNPEFSWTLPSDATGVSYLITDKATSNPGPKSDGLDSKVSFTNIGDGTQYFNIKFKEAGAWGLIAHYQFNIDTVAPVGFDVHAIASDNTQSQITFETTDALSGIDHYEIRVGDNGNWITVSADQAGKPYTLPSDTIGLQTVYVKAVDKAGNVTIESTAVTIVGGSAVGSIIGMWVAKLFNGIVNGISNYGLLAALLAGIIGVLILIYQLLGANIDKLWHQLDNRRTVRKTERKVDSTFDHIINDMKEEIKFLDTIGKHRPLGPEEKYLKSKLQQYMKSLKNSGR